MLFCRVFSVVFFLSLAFCPAQMLRLNEFVANPAPDGIIDEDGDREDWIELLNTGAAAESLAGYYLTDDADDLTKWALPTGSLGAGEYLLVFASNKDRSIDLTMLHTNFRISSGGEYLALTFDGGAGAAVVTEFSPEFPRQREGLSYGTGSGVSGIGYLQPATPRAANSISGAGLVEDTSFSVDRGFFTDSFQLEITTVTEDATIRYTTDGSTPTNTNGTVYSGPITISETTVLRAAAFKTDFFPTDVDTHTYLFLADISSQGNNPPGWPTSNVNEQEFDYGMDPQIVSDFTPEEMIAALAAIPSYSIVTDQDNLTDKDTGIYVNALNSGREWERPASVELLDDSEIGRGFQIDCGLRIRGGFSRNGDNPKHAFRLFFRDIYGPSSLRYPLFGPEGATEFERMDFRTPQNYSWSFKASGESVFNTFLREVLGRDLQGQTGNPYTRSRYLHLYLNGIYWGLFMTQERAESNFGETYLGGDEDDYDTIKSAGRSEGYDTEATDGELNGDWRTLFLRSRSQRGSPTQERYYEMLGLDANGDRDLSKPVLLDVKNLIDYMLIIAYTGNYDAPLSDFVDASNNWFALRNREADDRGFAYFVHDGEHSLGAGGLWNGANDRLNTSNGLSTRNRVNKSNPQYIHQNLSATADYQIAFADALKAAVSDGGLLTKENVLATLGMRESIVDQVIIAESARWGDAKSNNPRDRDDWLAAVDVVKDIIEDRAEVLVGHARTAGLYPDTLAPVFSQNPGTVARGSNVVVGGGEGTVYLTTDGSDPRLPGGEVNPQAVSFLASLSDPIDVLEKGSSWRYLVPGGGLGSSAVVVGASGYDPSNWKHPDFDDGSWASGAAPLGYGSIGASANSTDIATEIPFGGNTSVRIITSYFRNEFEVTDVETIAGIELDLFRDDGVIVYLNGVEIARSNMPGGEVGYLTTATGAAVGAAENQAFQFSVPVGLLIAGSNTISVELHQAGASSNDLAFDLSLGLIRADSESAVVAVNGNTHLRARALDGGEWSPITEGFFTNGIAASAANIVITEVNYDPAPLTDAESGNPAVDDADDFEFIEILNASSDTVHLGGVSLGQIQVGDELEGVTYIFPEGALLGAGARLVIAADSAALPVRYPGVTTTADYSGRLSNGGESIFLAAADGSVIALFAYDNSAPWPVAAAGTGATLELDVPEESGVDYASASSWKASSTIGGTPDPGSGGFPADPSADDDGDGANALFEYFSGTSDSDASAIPVLGATAVVVGGESFLELSYLQDPNAFGVSPEIQISQDLGAWETSSPTALADSTEPDGRIRKAFRIDIAPGGSSRQFVRLLLTAL